MVSQKLEETYFGAVKPRLFQQLNDSGLSNDQLLDVVFEIIERVSDMTPPKPVAKSAPKARQQRSH
jgi:hypothetical protein